MIDLAGIEAARQRIAPHVRRTPTLAYTQQKDGATAAASVIMKLELVQAAGSFKARGARGLRVLLRRAAHILAVARLET